MRLHNTRILRRNITRHEFTLRTIATVWTYSTYSTFLPGRLCGDGVIDGDYSPNSTWLVTSRLDTTRHVQRVERVETSVSSRAVPTWWTTIYSARLYKFKSFLCSYVHKSNTCFVK